MTSPAPAKQHVPDEHPPFVAVAKQMLERNGGKATPDAIRKRLRDQGRSMAQLKSEKESA